MDAPGLVRLSDVATAVQGGLWIPCCWDPGVVSPIDTVASVLVATGGSAATGRLECLHSLCAAVGSLVVQALKQPGEGAEFPALMTLLHFFSFSRALERGGCRPYLASAPSLTRAMGSAAQQGNGVTKHHSCISSVLPPL